MNEHQGAHLDPEARMVGKVFVEDPALVVDAMRIGTPTGDWYPVVNDCHTAAENAISLTPWHTTGVDNDGLNNGTF